MTLEQFVEKLEGVNELRNGWYMAKCPAHYDRNPSLSVMAGDPREDGRRPILMHCYAGCNYRDIREALGIPLADMWIEPEEGGETEE